MHAQGNDFVMLDGRIDGLADGLSAAQARQLADRQTGIGADQVLLLLPGKDDEFIYRIWNQDGGEVAQCGNGARAAYAFLRQLGLGGEQQRLRTSAGPIEVGTGAHGIRAWLAPPQFAPADIPLAHDDEAAAYTFAWEGQEFSFAALSLGNPHAVMMVEDVASAPVAELGAACNASADFPAGVNVGFAQLPPQQDAPYKLRVFERGVGETKACGSGAAALAVVEQRRCNVTEITLDVPGGRLAAGWDGGSAVAWVEGEVTHVFAGSFELAV